MSATKNIKNRDSGAPRAFPALRDDSRIWFKVDGQVFSGRVIRGEGGSPPVVGKRSVVGRTRVTSTGGNTFLTVAGGKDANDEEPCVRLSKE